MNKDMKYFLVFAAIPIFIVVGVSSSISYVDSLDKSQNPDSYTINTSEIITYNGHVLKCTYKGGENFAYVIGCYQKVDK